MMAQNFGSLKSKVSICTPTKNRQPFIPILAECIKNQSYPKSLIEWVIVDDSDEPAKEMIDSLGLDIEIKYHYSKSPLTIGKKRNLSNEIATGDIMINMDDDDFYPIERISHAVDTLNRSECLIAGCSLIPLLYIDEVSLWLVGPFGQNHATANTFAYKKELLDLTSYRNEDTYAEEKHFLKNYQLKMEQLEAFKTLICIAHNQNTVNKYELRSRQSLTNQPNSAYKKLQKLTQGQQEIIEEISTVYSEAVSQAMPGS